MTFPEAVGSCPALAPHLQEGVQAIPSADRPRILSDRVSLSGSIDLDEALRESCPNDPRWDYALGIRSSPNDRVIWMEVHSANSAHVTPVLNKLQWLKAWLRSHAPELGGLPAKYVWVATGRVQIASTGRQRRSLAEAGILLRRQVDLSRM